MAINDLEANSFHWLVDMLESVEVGLVVLDLDFRDVIDVINKQPRLYQAG